MTAEDISIIVRQVRSVSTMAEEEADPPRCASVPWEIYEDLITVNKV